MSSRRRPQGPMGTTRRIARLALGMTALGLDRLGGNAPPSKTGVGGAGDPRADRATTLRHAAVGLVLESDRGLNQAEHTADELLIVTRRRVEPVLAPIRRRRTATRFASFLDRLEERGRAEVDRVVLAGAREEEQAVELARRAVRDITASSVDEVVEVSVGEVVRNPVIREVVREETSSTVDHFLDDVKTVTREADARVQHAVRPGPGRSADAGPAATPAPPGVGAEAPALQAPAPEPLALPSGVASAGFISRLLALAVDAWLLTVGIGSAVFTVSAVVSLLQLSLTFDRDLVPGWVAAGLGFATTVGYLVLFWAAFGRTPGKALFGLRVVRTDGTPLNVRRSLLRALGYLLSALPLYAGFLWVLVDRERRGWHDRLAGSRVIYADRNQWHEPR